jgi:hypothetical protein
MSHQKLRARFPTKSRKRCGQWESVAAVCARWRRRYRRKGFGRKLGNRRRVRHAEVCLPQVYGC